MAGASMIEALVGMLLIAIWLLSNAGLQANSLKFQAGATSRFSAITLASELGERMEANAVGATGGSYTLAETAVAPTVEIDCTALACTPAQIAAYDLAQWTASLVAQIKQLKSVSVADVTPAAGPPTYTITIRWDEPRGRQSYESAPGASATSETMSYTTTKAVRNATV